MTGLVLDLDYFLSDLIQSQNVFEKLVVFMPGPNNL